MFDVFALMSIKILYNQPYHLYDLSLQEIFFSKYFVTKKYHFIVDHNDAGHDDLKEHLMEMNSSLQICNGKLL